MKRIYKTGSLQLLRLLLITSLFLVPLLAQAQGERTDALKLWSDTGFTEERYYFSGRHPELVIELQHNLPYDFHEDYDLRLFVKFAHRDSMRQGRTYDLAIDTAAVRAYFQFGSVWIWGKTDAEVHGTVKVIRRSWRKIILGFRLEVKRKGRENVYVYHGGRIFRRSWLRQRSKWWEY